MLSLQDCSMAERISQQRQIIVELQAEIARLKYEVRPPPLSIF